jgi:hypothetical protein
MAAAAFSTMQYFKFLAEVLLMIQGFWDFTQQSLVV